MPSPSSPGPLLTVRAAVVLLLACVVGLIAGGLTLWDGQSLPAALLVGGGAAGSGLLLFHQIID
jgi:hypothetical protein